LEYHKNIKATDREMQKLFENEEYNYSVRYFERIGEDLFKTVIRTPENIEFPKSKTLSINTIKKLLETDENINSMYIEDEFTKMKNKVYEFNQKKYPGYEDMDIKLIISNIKGIEDFDALNDFYEDLKRQGYLKDIKERCNDIDRAISSVSKGWKLDRMGKVELTILRLAVYEMEYDDSIPKKVAVNEAVELAKRFGGDDSPAFVNGILAKLI